MPLHFISACEEMNAREAMHMIELRTQPAGHPRTARWRRRCIARLVKWPDIGPLPTPCGSWTIVGRLERLESERRAEQRRSKANS